MVEPMDFSNLYVEFFNLQHYSLEQIANHGLMDIRYLCVTEYDHKNLEWFKSLLKVFEMLLSFQNRREVKTVNNYFCKQITIVVL